MKILMSIALNARLHEMSSAITSSGYSFTIGLVVTRLDVRMCAPSSARLSDYRQGLVCEDR